MAFLDENRTAELWSKVKSIVPTQSGGGATTVAFTQSEWVANSSTYTLTIPAAKNKLTNGDFSFQIFHLVGSVYKANTWGAIGTDVQYNSSNKAVTLESVDPYSGKILFIS